MDIILNKVAIWKAHGSTKLTSRVAPKGTCYINPGEAVYKNANDKSIIRYAKDYKIGKVVYCLFIRTFCEDGDAVEKALNSVAKQLDKAYVLENTYSASHSDFTYTNFIFDENTKEIK